MTCLKYLAAGLLALSANVAAAEITDPYCPLTFAPPGKWEQSESGYFRLAAADGAELTGMPIPDSAHGEPLEQVDQKASYFHSMSFGSTNPSAPEQVSGKGWKGLLRQQTTALGPEFQFVVRSEQATCLYYLRVPADASPTRAQELRQVLLSVRPSAGPQS
ncbi:hypothetical protein [Agrilutibacter solisilvae]|uniref:DUF1795 domain-containing protein n=1 Tax=Agrilutibacter solisilvae TaxID=2763317 RepID=A0A975ATQ9_9GAMM|nr:hypothetical protein [Lysobacter solisilvae]QSX79374.1 hypothetical protein I8J32_005800 [Lysobacter solisilvae]